MRIHNDDCQSVRFRQFKVSLSDGLPPFMGFGPGGDLQWAFLSLDDFVKRLAVAAFYFMHKEIVMISFRIIT